MEFNEEYAEGFSKLWKDDDEDLSKRVESLEARLEEMWERMKQMENVLTTAFRIVSAGDNPHC